jgi:hypothetical protein
MLAARAEPKNAGKKRRERQALSALGAAAPAGRAGLRGIACTFLRDGLAVAADLGQVDGFELQGEFHERVSDVSGGFIGDSVFRQRDGSLGRHHRLYP